MSDYPQDDLNAFFKSKLNSSEPDENMWNVPPDFVFDNAMNKINAQESKRRTSYWRWAILLIFLIGMFTSFLLLNNQKNRLNEENELLHLALESRDDKISSLENVISQQKSELENTLKEAHSVINTNQETSEYIETQVDIPSHNHIQEHNIINPPKVQNQKIFDNNQSQVSKTLPDVSNETIISNENDVNNESPLKPKTFIHIPFISSLANNIDDLAFEHNIININHDGLVILNENQDEWEEEAFKYGFFLNQNYSSLAMDNIPMSQSALLTQYDRNYSGLGFKFQAEKTVSSKVDMQFSLGYQNVQNRSHLDDSNPYDSQNEVDLGNGQMTYNVDVIIDTPFGEVGTQTNFDIDPMMVSPNDEIRQETNTTQSLNIISLNVGPKYNFVQSDNWSIFATANIGFNRILHYTNEMKTLLKVDDLTMTDFESKPPKIVDINKNYLSAAIGLGIGLSLTDNLQFVIDGQYGQSLNSLRVPKNSNGPLTYLKQWQSQVGLNYIF